MDIQKIEQLIQVVKGAEVSELSLESDSGKVRIRKGLAKPSPAAKTQAAPKPQKQSAQTETPAAQAASNGICVISAPMVGIFHSLNGAVKVGSVIKAGQVVGSIESMKLMNDLSSDIDGKVEEVLVEDGAPVEYGQPLLRLVCD